MIVRPRTPFFALAALLVATLGAAAADPAPATPPTDPTVELLVREALSARPELKQADARARAERERIPQARALPDPVLSLGIQNDGFDSIEIGTMETSFLSVGLSQELPWPGKRALRGKVAELGADQARASVDRLRLATEAEVRRGYLDLLLVRDRLALLERLTALWQKSEAMARARYEVGSAPQSDILRAQLERSRLSQRRFALDAEERERLQALNRLRNRPLDEPIATTGSVRDLSDPAVAPVAEDLADAEARSPELRGARVGIRRAEAGLDLARKERLPDFGVSAGVMPRGGLEPMWQVGVSVNLPFLWGRGRRQAAIAEARLLTEADRLGSEAVVQVLRLRVAERRTALAALLDTLRVYRDGLLVQSNATVESTLAQYRVGRVTFASVLEAVAGYIADEDAYLQTIAGAQRIAIARAEVSLDPVLPAGAGGMASGAMPGAGATGTGTRAGGGQAPAPIENQARSSMGGM
jgi:cobalt-zinc-cadmium efflux system outer membrane protein